MSRDLSAKPLVLVVGAVIGAAAALVASGRTSSTDRPRGSDHRGARRGGAGGRPRDGQDQDSTTSALLTGDHHWAFETSTVVHRTAGEVALHVHEKVDLPGLQGPLDGPPMDRVEWQGPGDSVLRLQIHGMPGGTSTEVMFQAAPAEGSKGAMPHGLEGEARKAMNALRSAIER